jgi:hypothetical protein
MAKLNESRKLNLGSGDYPKNGYVNVDFYSIKPPDIHHDLEIIPYPFPDNHFEVIEADHVLEHLSNPFKIMAELYRISTNNAFFRIKVPHFSRGFTHADHKRGFDVTFAYYFDPNFTPGYQGINLKLEKLKMHWFAQPYLKKLFLPAHLYYLGFGLGKIMDFFANLSPWACSRIWCFWVGGFEEIEFVFKVIKD